MIKEVLKILLRMQLVNNLEQITI